MSLNILKRLDVSSRIAHVLLREQLKYGLELAEIYASSSTSNLTARELFVGVDGSCDSNTPQTFTAVSGTFTSALIGKYLTLHGTNANNAGIHKIIGVPDANTLIVQGGIYGSRFTTDVSISWRVIDPTANNGATEFIIQGVPERHLSGRHASSSMLQTPHGSFGSSLDPAVVF